MSSRGFLIFAENTPNVDYIQQAYALALSIKATQSVYTNVSLVTDDVVPEQFLHAFDKIVPVPFESSAESDLKTEKRWSLYHATPYDETIVLDSDMLVLEDVTSWWEYLKPYDLKFCSTIKNYKGEHIVEDLHHRKTFVVNGLPNPYCALYYFKKTDSAHEFFKVLDFVVRNWELCYGKFAPEQYQNWLSMDLAVAITMEMVGLGNDTVSPLEFVHMKPAIQNWPMSTSKWTNAVHYHFNKRGELLVGNIKQQKIFHYVEKDFVSTDMLHTLKEIANGR